MGSGSYRCPFGMSCFGPTSQIPRFISIPLAGSNASLPFCPTSHQPASIVRASA